MPKRGPVPSPRETAWLPRRIDTPEAELTAEERSYGEAVCVRCPEPAEARRRATEFVRMLTARDANALAPWLDAARRSALKSFAGGIEDDRDAVLAGLLFRWSNGQVEGHVHRLKAIKRALYGRATLDLLRKRVLHRAA